MKVNGGWMWTADTGTGHKGIKWDATLHDIEYLNPEEQVPNTNKRTNTENSAKTKNGDSHSTNKNPSVIRTNVPDDSSNHSRDQHKEVAKFENINNDKTWPLMEIQYGIKSIALPSTCKKGDTRDSMNLLNETPENLNGEPRKEDLEDA